ncbi:unnamed protein product [Hyaloperonospora brassicae]|uniref:PX domain-containing protein n=1 Tax=Hyaloperonospora brassicae TaxID=162125 RepID=A0AAV0UQX7_HYABA|nr:unnamed protein product [Hyaloperonospora brassicae]
MEPRHVSALAADELVRHTRELVERRSSVAVDNLLQRTRHSLSDRMATSEAHLPSFSVLPDHVIIGTTVRFLDVFRVSDHCTFKLLVDTGKEQFAIQRRYSQFRALRQQLLRKVHASETAQEKGRERRCPNGACQVLARQLATLKFPRRKLKLKLHRDDDIRTARERQMQLQHFIASTLAVYRMAPKRQVRCCVNLQCHVLTAIGSFLDIRDLGEEEPAGWTSNSHGTASSDEVPLQDTPSCLVAGASSSSTTENDLNESPVPRDTSMLCLEELFTIMEDTEHSQDTE